VRFFILVNVLIIRLKLLTCSFARDAKQQNYDENERRFSHGVSHTVPKPTRDDIRCKLFCQVASLLVDEMPRQLL